MVSKEDYLKSLAKLETREKLSLLASENGKLFLSKYNSALEQSKKDNKNILLFFHMNGCDGCTVVQYLLDNDEKIKNQLVNYIVLYYSAGETKTNLIQKYNIYSYPSLYVIDNNENIIKQKFGIKVLNNPEQDLLNWFNKT